MLGLSCRFCMGLVLYCINDYFEEKINTAVKRILKYKILAGLVDEQKIR